MQMAFTNLSALFTIAAALGCSTSGGSEVLREFEAPQPGERVPDSFWAEAETATDKPGVRSVFWPVPFVVDADVHELEGERDRVRSIGIGVFNLGLVLLPTLPFYVGVEYGRFWKDGREEHSKFRWTPFWAWSENSPGSVVKLEASGVPLLWGDIEIDSPEDELELDIRHYLWSLGPVHLHLNKAVGDKHVVGTTVMPFYLAGLGYLVWTSNILDSEFGSVDAHGLLGGYLGYYRSEGLSPQSVLGERRATELLEPIDATDVLDEIEPDQVLSRFDANGNVPSTELWLGGILWSSFADTAPDGQEYDGRHGPLWTMFGYGTDEGEDAIILFWFKI
jgi:hypothetical protein